MTNAFQDVESLYDDISPLKPGERLQKGYYKKLMKRLQREFNVTSPNEDITNEDKVAVAGIYDRLKAMRDDVTAAVGIVKDVREDAVWDKNDRILSVPERFFSLTPVKQVEDAVRALIYANPSINEQHRSAFVDTVTYLRDAGNLGEPS